MFFEEPHHKSACMAFLYNMMAPQPFLVQDRGDQTQIRVQQKPKQQLKKQKSEKNNNFNESFLKNEH